MAGQGGNGSGEHSRKTDGFIETRPVNGTAARPAAARPDKSRKARLRNARADAEGRVLHHPSRKVIVKSPVRILREIMSVKMGAYLPCESGIEYDWYQVLDVRRDVAAFHAQPERAEYRDGDGKLRTHWPDVLVGFTSGAVEYQEVKPDEVAAHPAYRALHAHIAAAYADRGLVHRVVAESEARAEPRLSNAKALRHQRVRQVDPMVLAEITRLVADGTTTLHEIRDRLGRGPSGVADVLALVLRGRLEMDWETVAIGPESRVRLAGGGRP